MKNQLRIVLAGVAVLLCVGAALGLATQASKSAQAHITTPKEEFGHNFGDDYFLASYRQISAYWRKLAKESPRIVLHEMGKTPEGNTQLMAIVTSPANQKKLENYRQIS